MLQLLKGGRDEQSSDEDSDGGLARPIKQARKGTKGAAKAGSVTTDRHSKSSMPAPTTDRRAKLTRTPPMAGSDGSDTDMVPQMKRRKVDPTPWKTTPIEAETDMSVNGESSLSPPPPNQLQLGEMPSRGTSRCGSTSFLILMHNMHMGDLYFSVMNPSCPTSPTFHPSPTSTFRTPFHSPMNSQNVSAQTGEQIHNSNILDRLAPTPFWSPSSSTIYPASLGPNSTPSDPELAAILGLLSLTLTSNVG